MRLTLPPRLLEIAYQATLALLSPFRAGLRSGGLLERLFVPAEAASKGLLFGCKMCGQCVLHSTGMTCPMNCPKNMRNGPCGGVRPDGRCEVIPEMPCVWVQAWEGSRQMARHGGDILRVLPPLDRRLEGTSAWVNHFRGTTGEPAGWSR